MLGGPGAQNGKGAKIDPNYVLRLLLDCVPLFHKIITPAYLLYRSGPDRSLFIIPKFIPYPVDCRFELALEVQRWTRARSECLPGGGQKLYLRHCARLLHSVTVT